jgi:hypothetical protein
MRKTLNEDYGPHDWDTVVEGGNDVMGEIQDIVCHNIPSEETWAPWAGPAPAGE